MTPAFLRASMEGDRVAARRELGAELPPDWPGEAADVVSLRLAELDQDPELQLWLLRAMVLRGSELMVGYIGFHAAPGAEHLEPHGPGAVEFGYCVFSRFRRRGYAREAAGSLMQWAARFHRVDCFVVSIDPENIPSQRLAARLGFVRVGFQIDEIDGLEEVLELRIPTGRGG